MKPSFGYFAAEYLKFALGWTPGLCLVFAFAFGGFEHLGMGFVLGLVIAEPTTAVCFWGSIGVVQLERRFYERRGWPWTRPGTGARLLRSIPFMVPGMWLGFKIAAAVAPLIGAQFQAPDPEDWRQGIIFGLFASAIFAVTDLRKEARVARAQAQAADMRSKLAALTAQLNPHLLFNALNAIASMIHTSPDDAEKMTVTLAGLYRRVLAATKKDRHALADELELVTTYLQLEQGRFGDRVTYAVKVGPGVDAATLQVPVLCLQPFVENAVKHGLLGRSQGGRVEIAAAKTEHGYALTVTDDGVGVGNSRAKDGSGTAVANGRERMALLYGTRGELTIGAREGGGTVVTLALPEDGGGA